MRGTGGIIVLLLVAGGLAWYLFFRKSGPTAVNNTGWLDAFMQYENTLDKPLAQASAAPSSSAAAIDNTAWLTNLQAYPGFTL